MRDYNKKYHHRMTTIAIERLGGPHCVLCGCKETTFLTIDHINGGGHQHRKLTGTSMYRWIAKATDKELKKANLRVLCFNCNCALNRCSESELLAILNRG